jgi:hypothetical protein
MNIDFLCVDMGASETRYVSSLLRVPNTAPNNYTLTAPTVRETDSNLENNLDVTVETADKTPVHLEQERLFPVRVYMGSLASGGTLSTQTPNGLKQKMRQPINYYSILVSCALDALYAEHTSIDIKDLYIAVPPLDALADGVDELVRDILQRDFTLKFHRLNAEIKVKIRTIHIKEEGHAAFIAYAFNPDGKSLTEGGKACLGNIALSLDIGSSTTDIVIISNFSYTSESVCTINRGGRTVGSRLQTSVRGKNNHSLSPAAIEEAVREGRYRQGNKYFNVSDLLDKAKEETAALIVEETVNFITGRNIALSDVSRVIVSGGGSMSAKEKTDGGYNVTSIPLSDFILQELRKYNDSIEVDRCGDENETKNPLLSPRFANLAGLFIMAGQKK